MEQLKIEFLYEHPLYKDYACDEEGNPYSMKNGKIRKLKPANNGNGYLDFGVYKGGKRVAHSLVHRFVWECIKGKIEEGYEVDHLDFDRENNCIDNLLAIPASENRARQSEEGKKKKAERLSKAVLQLDKQGNIIAEYPSTIEAERQTGIAQSNISSCCLGKYKQANGFIWQYAS